MENIAILGKMKYTSIYNKLGGTTNNESRL